MRVGGLASRCSSSFVSRNLMSLLIGWEDSPVVEICFFSQTCLSEGLCDFSWPPRGSEGYFLLLLDQVYRQFCLQMLGKGQEVRLLRAREESAS